MTDTVDSTHTHMTDISLDIETLAVTPRSVILTVAAVKFCAITGAIGESIYQRLDFVEQQTLTAVYPRAREVDKATEQFWNKQPPETRKEAFNGEVPILDMLNDLKAFCSGKEFVWGNGATFDVTILETAFLDFNMPIPWKFWNVRDMRTIVALAKDLHGFNPKSIKPEGPRHHALYDAKNQARIISAARATLATPR